MFFLHWKFIRIGENHHFYSPYVSSSQRLPNGNTLITEGFRGRIFEVNNNEIVWEYNEFYNTFYRAYRIPPEWVCGNPSGYDLWENET